MKRFAFLLLSFLSRFLLFPLYALGWLLPRRDSLWVFGSWGGYRYADNAAAFFRYCNDRLDDVDLVWISRRRDIVRNLRADGYRAAWAWSPAGVLYCLRAGRYLFDCFAKDINFWTSGGARLVNLWSGVPLKTFERDIDHPDNRYYRLFHGNLAERVLYGMMMPWHVKRPDRIIAMSNETAEITRRAFDVDAGQVLVTGFPRNDALFRETPADSLPGPLRQAKADGRQLLLYLPTFRDSGKPFLQFDWERLNERMRELDAVFICKFHPVDASELPRDRSHVKGLAQDIDVYSLLPHADALVSDYSSIIFDYMLLDRPVIYYAPDIDEFVSENRSLNFDPLDIAVGPVCRDFDALLCALSALGKPVGDATLRERPARTAADEKRAAVYARLHAWRDDAACARVLDALVPWREVEDVGSALPDTEAQYLERTPQQGQ